MKRHPLISTCLALLFTCPARAFDYPYTTAEPQKSGWPLSEEERAYVLKPEHERRPGREVNQHKPQWWPVIPSAGHWGGTSWLDTHAKLVEYVKANPGPCDVLLVGDSLTQQWGSPLDKGVLNEAWRKYFASYRTINIGFGGDKTQNVLWRLDHGGVQGLLPRVIVVMIGNNNIFFTSETGIEAAAKGVQTVVANVRDKFPPAEVIVVKILPAHAPGNRFYEDIKKTNLALDPLKLDGDPKVHVLDLWSDFTNTDGTIKAALFTPDNIHLSLAGYAVYAERLKPLLDKCLGKEGLGTKDADLRMTPEDKAATAASASGTSKAGSTSRLKSDPARLARIRAAKMPTITQPVLFDTPEADAICSALEVFPPDNPWNQLVDDWPRHPNSDAIIASIGRDKPFRYNPDMGFVLVPSNQLRVQVKIVGYRR